MNTAQHQIATALRRRLPLQLGPVPRPDPRLLPDGYSVDEKTGVGYVFVIDVDAVAAGRC